jgi:hypothetical protein
MIGGRVIGECAVIPISTDRAAARRRIFGFGNDDTE